MPESLLAVPTVAGGAAAGAADALARPEAYSPVHRRPGQRAFSVHPLVQAVTRQHHDGSPPAALRQALGWVDAAFAGDPTEVCDWPALEPLLPHARAGTAHADAAGIADPTSRLMDQAGTRPWAKALYAEAGPLMRRALEGLTRGLGPHHPYTQVVQGNLDGLPATMARARRGRCSPTAPAQPPGTVPADGHLVPDERPDRWQRLQPRADRQAFANRDGRVGTPDRITGNPTVTHSGDRAW